MTPRVGLSTSSVFPEPTAVGFELALRLGYDGVEVMVGKTGGVPGSTWATGSRFVRVRENSRPGGTRRRAQPIAQE